jgi:hypothetical protein
MPVDPTPNGKKRPLTRRLVILAVTLVGVAAIVVFVASRSSGPHPEFAGPVEALRQGTQGGYDDVAIGMGGVWDDGASFHMAGKGHNETLDLGIGEEGEFEGVHLRLCGVWVDKHLAIIPPPGSYASEAYFVVRRGDSAPDCPEKL